MRRKLSALQGFLETLAQLIHAVQVAWNKVPQADIDRLILSMPRHIQECTQLQDRLTHYCFFLS